MCIIFIWCSEIYLANQSGDILLLLSIVTMSESGRKVWRSCKSERKKQYKKKQKRCGLVCSGRVSSSCLTSGTRCIKVTRHERHLIWKLCWTPIYVKKTNKTYNFTYYDTPITKWHWWPWSYGSWIYSYLCHLCMSPLKFYSRFMARCSQYNNMW